MTSINNGNAYAKTDIDVSSVLLTNIEKTKNAQTLDRVKNFLKQLAGDKQNANQSNNIGTSPVDTASGTKWANASEPKFTLVGSETYEYPYLGKERQIGAEKTTFLKHYYDGNGKFLYTEVIREADNSVLQKITPDGKIEKYSVPAVSKENINKFNEKYDLERIRKEMTEQKKIGDEDTKKQREAADKSTTEIISSTTSKPFTNNANSQVTIKPPVESKHKMVQNYSIRKANPSQELLSFFVGETFRDVNYNNVTEKPLGDITTQIMEINNRLLKENMPIKLIVTFMPYSCDELPNGYVYRRRYENAYEILLFNNKKSFIDQFNALFQNYLSQIN